MGEMVWPHADDSWDDIVRAEEICRQAFLQCRADDPSSTKYIGKLLHLWMEAAARGVDIFQTPGFQLPRRLHVPE